MPENDQPGPPPHSAPPKGSERVIQPSATIKQELQAAQQAQTGQAATAAPVVSTPAPTATPTAPTAPVSNGRIQVGMSASQMGLNQPKSKLLDLSSKKLLMKGGVVLVLLGVIFAVLVFTNVVSLGTFKTIDYTSSKGTHYKLKFYAKHGSKQLQSGSTQLVSKVSNDGKFPLALSISNGTVSAYSRVKNCAGFDKVFDVQNNKLNQKISVCDFGKQAISGSASGDVYVAGFLSNDQASIVTIGQDYSSIDLSSPKGAQESLTKFGLDPYQDDIKTILSSIQME